MVSMESANAPAVTLPSVAAGAGGAVVCAALASRDGGDGGVVEGGVFPDGWALFGRLGRSILTALIPSACDASTEAGSNRPQFSLFRLPTLAL
jgi:hypothetical protein